MSLEVIYAAPSGPPPSQHPRYDPPPGPPPSYLLPPALLPAKFPLIFPGQAHSLATQGFTPFPIADHPALLDAATTLFAASRTFFSQPEERKTQFRVPTANKQGSEEGWSRVAGEKELLTLRRGGSAFCPPSIEGPARVLWRECGMLMQQVTRGVEESLGMKEGALDGVVSGEILMPEEGADRLETLLRMFRYERRGAGNEDEMYAGKGRLVAEPHRDLGLLSLVIGSSPGLEVFDSTVGAWIPIEAPPYADAGCLTATLLVGESLNRLTNSRYVPGRHRVFVPPASDSPEIQPADADADSEYRFSLVFALRPHSRARISTAAFTTPITGPFVHPLENVQARELFVAVARSHWNINTNLKEREAQRLRLLGGRDEMGENRPDNETNVAPKSEKKRWGKGIRLSSGGGIKPWSIFRPS